MMKKLLLLIISICFCSCVETDFPEPDNYPGRRIDSLEINEYQITVFGTTKTYNKNE